MLRRSPALLGVLVAYRLVIALLIGLTAAYANSSLVSPSSDKHMPHRVTVAGESFDIDGLVHQVAKNVELVRIEPESDASDQLASAGWRR